MEPRRGSLALYSSRTVRKGRTRLAKGTNHHPTAHPGEYFRPCAPSARRFRCARNCQMSHAMAPPTMARTSSACIAAAAGPLAIPDPEETRAVAEDVAISGVREAQGSLPDAGLRRRRGGGLVGGGRTRRGRQVTLAVPALDRLVLDLLPAVRAPFHPALLRP